MKLQDRQLVNIRNSSKGNQLKWYAEGRWYKADYLGYEGLSEYVTSRLLEKTNVEDYVRYEVSKIQYNGNEYVGCVSDSFLKEGEELITLDKLFRQFYAMDLTRELLCMETEEKIKYVTEQTEQATGLLNFGAYLTMLLELDAFIFNEDRHMNNIALVYSGRNGKYRYCPVFDNGAAFFSDTRVDYDLRLSVEQCAKKAEAKPFSKSFDQQMDIAERLYGQQLAIRFTEKDAEEYLKAAEGYPKEIKDRILEVIRMQLRKYRYFRQ